MLLTVHVCLLLNLHAVAAGDRNITLGLLLPVGIAGNRIMTSVEIATQTVDQRLAEGTLRGFTLSFIPRRTGTFCGPAIRLLATVHAAELHYIHNVDGFVGHFCSYQTLPVADMTFTWNLPILTGGTFFDTTVDETRYSTLTRTAYGLAVFSETLKNILDEFNWEICTIILPQTTAYATIGSNVGEMLLSLGKIVTFRRVEPDKMDSWEEFLRSVSEKARVIIFALRGEYVREIMVTAYSLGLINGEFAFIDIEPFPNKQFFGDHNWQKGDEFDEQARIAYEALFAVRLFQSTGEEYMKYRAQMKRQLLEKYNYTEPFPNDTNFFIEAFYDAVTLYSLAVNETLAEGGDVRDGHLVVSKMWNRITGTVAINENGGRDTEVIVWDMTDTENGTFYEIFQYNQTVGQLTPFGTRAPTWPAGRTEAPADRPFCGFDNENPACQDITNGLASILYAVGSTVAVMIVLSSITMFYIYRRISLDAELKEMTWRVKWDDLFFSKFRHSTFSRSVSVGKLVQVKNIKKAKIDLTRDVLLELRNMRLIEHGNVVRFVGACVDAPHIAVIQEHCSKGCLEVSTLILIFCTFVK
ncbi:Atrial natriuretic peptide receptor 1 [Holothuria leucospilota]|uniref:Atrial natriuretic peptide receptor 1 n=1 Tax=Holothuria leucospilota TaxID=206669 RepID=A0A9Q1H8G3_HOLLE|nr:Atrial natriuretic peptide receptor 1 [Holothuria leucospilota]